MDEEKVPPLLGDNSILPLQLCRRIQYRGDGENKQTSPPSKEKAGALINLHDKIDQQSKPSAILRAFRNPRAGAYNIEVTEKLIDTPPF